MSDGYQAGTQPMMAIGPELDRRIFAATGTDAPPEWTDRQKEQWLLGETRRNEAAASNSSEPYNHKQQGANTITLEELRLSRANQLALRLQDERAAILNYMWQKAAAEDWHAVADAAMDLREIDAKLSVLRA